jgi:RNA polymerase sigma-70 factor (ECF subfamily)
VRSELVAAAQRGDRKSFDVLAASAVNGLYAIARRILRDGYLAEDAVQETLVRAWRELQSLRDVERFDAWLHRLLVNACNDQVRNRRRRPMEVPLEEYDFSRVVDDINVVVDRDAIERAFLALKVEHRAALVLVHYVGHSATEVAEILGIPVGTVYSRLHYGVRAMREALAEPPPSSLAATELGR